MKASFAVAQNFQCKGSWANRLLIAEGDGWRAPDENEVSGLTRSALLDDSLGDDATRALLFAVPAHMRARFWAMLDEEASEGRGDFDVFSDDLADFLTFKEMSPPADAVCELVIQDQTGKVATHDLWGLVNFGEEPVMLGWPQLQLRL
ncbi:hypothetical protein, partial [Pseudorhodoplanes sp.]|uniref:hypothetical protein n=1 Tax=Pseudorhodoplanes sp. TaxID=1934341 RepID=UPI00391D1B91